MKYIAPLVLHDAYYTAIEREIKTIFFKAIYGKLASLMKIPKKDLENSISDPLYKAVASGKLSYVDGKFTGMTDSKTVKRLRAIGAKYKKGVWYMPAINLPPDISMAIAQAESRYKALAAKMIKALDDTNLDKIIEDSAIHGSYFKTISSMDDAFKHSIKGIAIAPDLTIAAKKMIAEQWGTNLQLYIKDWAKDNILALRQQIQANVMQGNRAAALTKTIQDNYGVSQRKAKFLARQETTLLLSKMREERYKDVGITKYRWSGAMDERERHDHKLLEGKVISWDSPPIVDRKTGRRAHAGEDFGCRCVPIAIIE